MDELEKQMREMKGQADKGKFLLVQFNNLLQAGQIKQDEDNVMHVVDNPLERQMLQLSQQDDPQSQQQASQILHELESQKQTK